jgi:type III restriction enzyme
LQLSRWLDRQCRQPDLAQPVLLEFCRKIVAYLTDTRHLAMNDLLRFKYPLAKAVQQKIGDCRRLAYAKDYQAFLFAPAAAVETRFADGFAFGKRPFSRQFSYWL